MMRSPSSRGSTSIQEIMMRSLCENPRICRKKSRPMVRTTFLLLGLLGAFLGRPSVEAATYYVATTGSDINSCAVAQSPATPLQTIAAGIACLSSGDTLLVGDGNYAETIEANTIPNGTS